MKKLLLIGLSTSLLFLSSCWDAMELNDRAFWIASGWDVAEDGKIEFSGQIAIPSHDGQSDQGIKQKFFIVSATGINTGDALQNAMNKLSRVPLFGHQRVSFIGEEFAKRGIKKHLDNLSRTPLHNLRGDILVVKNGTAKDIISTPNPLEDLAATATLKEHRHSGGRGDTGYLHFLIAANREGIRPTIPMIEISSSIESRKSEGPQSPNPGITKLSGVSVFDKELKMLGGLNSEENKSFLWVMGLLTKMTISTKVDDGNASINLTKIKSKINPILNDNNDVTFTVNLTGEGHIEENNTPLDLSEANNIKQIEEKFATKAEKQVKKTITKVQDKYGMDIFGFGEAIHQKYPKKWATIKSNWDDKFPETNITVKANIKVKQIGMDGPSLLFRESEIKK